MPKYITAVQEVCISNQTSRFNRNQIFILKGDTYSCDLCGIELPSGKIQETDDFIFLCISCFNYLEDLPEGQIKESIKDFLLGNVI